MIPCVKKYRSFSRARKVSLSRMIHPEKFISYFVLHLISVAIIIIMQNQTEIAPDYLTNLSKLDELLRHYQIIRQAEKFQ
jgi:hypothetical protein